MGLLQRKKSIRRRVWVDIMLTCLAVALLSMGLYLLSAFSAFKQTEKQFQQSLATTLAENVTASLVFNHQASAQQLLDGLQNDESLAYAFVFDSQGQVFATTESAGAPLSDIVALLSPQPGPVQVQLQEQEVLIKSLYTEGGELEGYLVLASSGALFAELLADQFTNAIWQLLFILLIAVLISRSFAKSLTQPILNTSEFIGRVIAKKDYSLQMTELEDDEFGYLQQGLNEMIELARKWTNTLENYSEELKREVAAQTESLVQAKAELEVYVEEIKHARDQAEAASEAKSQFLANMSHEIRTPMHGILGMAELLEGTSLTAHQAHFVETIQHSANNLLHIINDVLDYSKIEQGHVELNPESHVLRHEIESVLELLYPKAQAKELELVLDFPLQDEETFSFDNLRLNQVLTNLIGNAIKFTHSGRVSLICRLELRPSVAQVDLCVKDTGVGIAASKLDAIFESFQQADSTTTRDFGGTGLGLSISKLIVKKMGGELQVDSEPGAGSEFRFSLKLPRVLAKAPLNYAQKAIFRGHTMLAICDSPGQAGLIEEHGQYWQLETIVYPGVAQFEQALAGRNILNEASVVLFNVNSGLRAHLPSLIQRIDQQANDKLKLVVVGQTELEHKRLLTHPKPVYTRQLFHLLHGALLDAPYTAQNETAEDSNEYLAESDVNVLLADDNFTNLDYAGAVLTKLGCNYELVENGQKALEAFSAGEFDIVLMDCQMPVMDGYSSTRAIRAFELQQDRGATPIIALTAHILDDEKQKCLNSGMDDYLSKPYSIKDLIAKMNQHLPKDKRLIEQAPVIAVKGNGSAALGQATEATRVELDQTRLNNIRCLQRKGEDSVLVRIIDRYIDESARMIQEIKHHRKAKALSEIQTIAHKLKTSSRNLGGMSLGHFCETVERLTDASWTELDLLLDAIEQEYQATVETLQQEKKAELEQGERTTNTA